MKIFINFLSLAEFFDDVLFPCNTALSSFLCSVLFVFAASFSSVLGAEISFFVETMACTFSTARFSSWESCEKCCVLSFLSSCLKRRYWLISRGFSLNKAQLFFVYEFLGIRMIILLFIALHFVEQKPLFLAVWLT